MGVIEQLIVGTQLALYLLEERMATGVNAVLPALRHQHQFVGEPINPMMPKVGEQLFSYDLPFQQI